MTDKITTAIAGGAAVGFPWWLSYINGYLAVIAGVLGVIFLCMQIAHKWRHWND